MGKAVLVFILSSVFLTVSILPAIANDTSSEIEDLRNEVNRLRQMEEKLKTDMQRLLDRLDELEKKQAATETKALEAEQKVTEVMETKEMVVQKQLKDRVDLSGAIRFRITHENATTPSGFYGDKEPSKRISDTNSTGFPLRIRLNAHAEAVPDLVDVYARLTMNKRWGSYSVSPGDPFDQPNSFESSTGHDMEPRFEQAYGTFQIPSLNSTWYVGRLPGMDGPPVRQARSLFPRLFIDSEIDGTLIKWTAPQTALDTVTLPWTETRLWGEGPDLENSMNLSSYKKKMEGSSNVILGYLKYDERGLSLKDDADVVLAQAEIKFGKETSIVLDGLYMDDWHMPRSSFSSGSESYKDSEGNIVTIPDLSTNYYLYGFYADTQVLGLQLYGAFYNSYFEIPRHTWTYYEKATDKTTENKYKGNEFSGHLWYLGFNTGDLISQRQQLTVEYFQGSDEWINPFNYRGFRRRGTVLKPANNYFYNSGSDNVIVGYYPFNAQVWDIYYDYYYTKNVRFRLGYLDFLHSSLDGRGNDFAILGSSKYRHIWWPYFEINVAFK
jgi:hypothetical protein